MRRARFLFPAFLLLAACSGGTASAQDRPFQVEEIGRFNEPWAMTFLPDGDLLVTEKRGALKLNRARPTTAPRVPPSPASTQLR